MKKKTMVLGGLIAAVAITGYSVAGTYAKYASSTPVIDEARVAIWDVGINKVGTNDLFKQVYSTEIDGTSTNVVHAGVKAVAPGTTGSYTFKLTDTNTEVEYGATIEDNGSEDLTLYYTGTAGNYTKVAKDTAGAQSYSPLKYGISSSDNSVTKTNLTLANLMTELEDNITIAKDVEYTITWEWPAGDPSELDTLLGQNANDYKVSLDFTVNAVQTTGTTSAN